MTTASKTLLEQFPIRKSKRQKAAFRDWVCRTLQDAGYAPRVETLKGSANVVAGNLSAAELVVTAHYDTCAVLPFPNLLTPRNPAAFLGWQALVAAIMVVLVVAVEGLMLYVLQVPPVLALLATYTLLIFLIWWMMAGKANKHNVNDNTSGVITLLEVAQSLPAEQRPRIAFVFFDNEEKGLLGSAAFYKAHKAEMTDKLLLNFDCVADGDHILFFPSKQLRKDNALLNRLERAFPSAGEKRTEVCREGFMVYPSDQKHFPRGVGVAAFHKNKAAGYWLGRIHTGRDTVLEEENIELLRRGVVTLLNE